jgi:hypothetical protein
MLTGRKSGSISRRAPPGRRLASKFAIAASVSATWWRTARAVTRSKLPGSTDPAVMSPCRSSSLVARTLISERSRSKATALAVGSDALSKPRRNRSVATTNFQCSCARLNDVELFNMAPMHWIQQFRHQCQPLPLAFQMVTQNVFGHADVSLNHPCGGNKHHIANRVSQELAGALARQFRVAANDDRKNRGGQLDAKAEG